jgi:hypothetical protein
MDRPSTHRGPWWKKQVIWGTMTALFLGLLSVLVDQGGAVLRVGAVIAIAGVTLTFVVDLSFRVAEIAADRQRNENTLLQTQQELTGVLATLGPLVASSEACRDFLLEVIKEWQHIEGSNSLLHRRILEEQQLKFRSHLRALSSGNFAMDRQTFLQFRSLSLGDLQSMDGISAINPGYWRTWQGAHYLARQQEAIAAGLYVHRTLVLPQKEIGEWADIVGQQLDAGVDLTIVISEQVEPDDLPLLSMDRFLITDKGGVRGALFHSPDAQAHRLTSDESEIHDIEQILARIRAYEHPPGLFYPRPAAPE